MIKCFEDNAYDGKSEWVVKKPYNKLSKAIQKVVYLLRPHIGIESITIDAGDHVYKFARVPKNVVKKGGE